MSDQSVSSRSPVAVAVVWVIGLLVCVVVYGLVARYQTVPVKGGAIEVDRWTGHTWGVSGAHKWEIVDRAKQEEDRDLPTR